MIKCLIYKLILLLALSPMTVFAQQIHTTFPRIIGDNDRLVFYSHGLIAEGDDPRPVHPDFGVYDLPAIRNALFAGGDFHLISHQRPADTPFPGYADQLVLWVETLLDAGIDPHRITLIGFSRGAQVTAVAADRLKNSGINIAIMGLCFEGDFGVEGLAPLNLGRGHVLSIFEQSDVVKTCETLLERSTNAASIEEVAINTGKSHGAFYTPTPEWVAPLKDWLARTNR